MTGDEIERLAFQYVPEAFFRRALQAVYAARRLAWDDCRSRFADTEAANARPYVTRAMLEGSLRDAAGLTPGLVATVLKAEKGGWFHTEVRGGPVVLTQSSVSSPCALVDMSEFRRTLARSNQGVLWREPDDDTGPLYALLLHSRYQWTDKEDRERHGHLAGSAYVAFPAADLDEYIHVINLFERFPDVVAANMPEDWDREAQVRYLDRARRAASA